MQVENTLKVQILCFLIVIIVRHSLIDQYSWTGNIFCDEGKSTESGS